VTSRDAFEAFYHEHLGRVVLTYGLVSSTPLSPRRSLQRPSLGSGRPGKRIKDDDLAGGYVFRAEGPPQLRSLPVLSLPKVELVSSTDGLKTARTQIPDDRGLAIGGLGERVSFVETSHPWKETARTMKKTFNWRPPDASDGSSVPRTRAPVPTTAGSAGPGRP